MTATTSRIARVYAILASLGIDSDERADTQTLSRGDFQGQDRARLRLRLYRFESRFRLLESGVEKFLEAKRQAAERCRADALAIEAEIAGVEAAAPEYETPKRHSRKAKMAFREIGKR